MTFQIRHYRVRPGTMDRFVAGWRDDVVPLRRAFGFEVVGAWVDRERDEFLWIIGHDDFDAVDDAYYGSEERKALTGDRDPAAYLLDSTLRLMEPVEVPPA